MPNLLFSVMPKDQGFFHGAAGVNIVVDGGDRRGLVFFCILFLGVREVAKQKEGDNGVVVFHVIKVVRWSWR